ncbi:MAG: translesion error-prone DNA polymerase V autoproteolytic subunit [Chloroherpetonaceae bacterium]|nr:translesion error-prone DNA polymerase V autoproteolytic subunit [Chloroherpetonaceae bacterium]
MKKMKSPIEQPMRVVEFLNYNSDEKVEIPLYEARISAGFPSPAYDGVDTKLDLNDLLIRNRTATFFIRVEGESMKEAGIENGDILIVDRSMPAMDGNIVIAVVNNEFLVKRYRKISGKHFLVPENPDYAPIEITPEMEADIWGVVTASIHQFVRRNGSKSRAG